MMNFDSLELSNETRNILNSFNMEFVFQPIFSRDDRMGCEAFMRPENTGIVDLIQRMAQENKLHDLEVATFFGATLAFTQRGIAGKLCINSLPVTHLTEIEIEEYKKNFPQMSKKLVIEIADYFEPNEQIWKVKRKHIDTLFESQITLDGFGRDKVDLDSVEMYQPNMVKLDHSLVEKIDEDTYRQEKVNKYVYSLHKKGIIVIAGGIETEAEYCFLTDIGIDYFQGYYLGMPRYK